MADLSISAPFPLTSARLVAETLAAAAVPALSCVPGESFIALLDALATTPGLPPVIGCRHEHAAAMLAEAAGKLAGRPAVCLVTRGPGACNAAIGVHTAFQDETPLLLIVGQVARRNLGREAFQEVDLVAMFRPLAKHAALVARAAALPAAVADGLALAAAGRPGPVVLVVPEDVFAEPVGDGGRPMSASPSPPPPPEPEPGAMERLHRILGDAERPLLILTGGGWTAAARADIGRFARASGLPVAVGFRRLDLFDTTDPLFAGELGLGSDPALLARVRAADVVIVVGGRLDEATAQGYRLLADGAAAPALVHVEADPAATVRVYAPTLAIAATAAGFAAAAAALAPVGGERWHAWARAASHDHALDRRGPPAAGPLDLRRAMAILDARLPADAIITVDAGNFSGWPQRFLSFPGGRRFLGPGNGAMGYGLPAALAAALVAPGRPVVACVGDGGFGMTGQDLATAVQHGLKPVVLLFDNAMYGTIRMHQERLYPGRPVATALGVTDFAALAAAMGAQATRVTTTDAFAPALEAALGAGRAALLHLICAPRQLSTRLTLDRLGG